MGYAQKSAFMALRPVCRLEVRIHGERRSAAHDKYANF